MPAPPTPLPSIAGRRRLGMALIAGALVLLSALGGAAAFHSNRHLNQKQSLMVALHGQASEGRRLALMVADAIAATRQWLLTGGAEDRAAAQRAADALADAGRELAGRLAQPLADRGLPPVGDALEHVLRLRDQIASIAEREGTAAAASSTLVGAGAATTAGLRRVLDEFDRAVEREVRQLDADLRDGQVTGLALIGGSSAAMLSLLLAAVGMLARRQRAAERASLAMDRRGQDVATLFRMGELLQSSVTPDDIRRIVSHTAEELLPDLSGAFYVFNNSRDRLDILGLWGHARLPPDLPEHLAPSDCWALKRGRLHGRAIGDTLRCDHAGDAASLALCVPMQARGEVYGLLQFYDDGAGRLPAETVELAQALADGVSLALANLALREKLRNQALRDELTGLYNRRFLEETLARLVAHAERRGAPVSVLMLDLDHFKQVNDRHGHAVGDAVLREVGALLTARLRRMDIACRYGGEELIVLLPDCPATDALARANDICAAVRALRERAESILPAVTVSIGVATWPEHGEQVGKVIEAADAALYAAKRAGRDRAVPAEAAAPALGLPVEGHGAVLAAD
ncbi:GGDEF domain-containing protein [Falsiroseomonas sp. HW251]|uniref:GGDEF domain-containing protein n=1 Tax=Falsiroseomonas sp. HW251 TaxID=3390998 RepID=UPI003D3224FA